MVQCKYCTYGRPSKKCVEGFVKCALDWQNMNAECDRECQKYRADGMQYD
jgi:hypothetical protein